MNGVEFVTVCLARQTESLPADGDAGLFTSCWANALGQGVLKLLKGFGELTSGVGSCWCWTYGAGVVGANTCWCGGAVDVGWLAAVVSYRVGGCMVAVGLFAQCTCVDGYIWGWRGMEMRCFVVLTVPSSLRLFLPGPSLLRFPLPCLGLFLSARSSLR